MTDALYDDAPDEPPMAGSEEERRAGFRRKEDRISHDMESWVARLFVNKGSLMLMVSVLSTLATLLGVRLVGPSQAIKELDAKFSARDSLMAIRVTRLEDRQDQITNRLAAIEEQIRFVAFLQCTSLRTTNPNLALDGCPTRRP